MAATAQVHGITINYERDSLFDELGMIRLREAYMASDETSPQERFAYVSKTFGSNPEHAQRLYDYASKHWLSYSTPILGHHHSKKGLGISCFLNYIDDSAKGLVDNLSESNWLSMSGGGVGVHVQIRSADEKSVGVMPHLKTYDSCSMAYKQLSRRGSYAAYLDLSHPDIVQFIEMRKATGDQNMRTLNLNHGVNIPNKFMEIIKNCMLDKDANDDWELIQPNTGKVAEVVSAKALWQKIIETRMQTGEPYLFFIDTANEYLPQYQKDAGLKIHGSNLCVAPETMILTDGGYFPIESLVGEFVNVWNGREFSNVQVVKTGENQELVTIKTNSGFSLDCTPYHKFYVEVRDRGLKTTVYERRACELKPGDMLVKLNTPVIEGDKELENSYVNGFFTGDGRFYKGKNIIYLYGAKRKILHMFPDAKTHTVQENQDRETLTYENLMDKYFVPNEEYTVKSRLDWLAGLLDSDGCLLKHKDYGTQSLQVSSVCEGFLEKVQFMLQTVGVQSKVSTMHKARKAMMPKNDGTGEYGEYDCKEVFRLKVAATGVIKLLTLGLKTHRLDIKMTIPNRECTQFVQVSDVIYTGRISDTYCFTEPKLGMGVFNGILTGQCSEISLPTNAQRTAVCCLSSVNLELWDEWKSEKLFIRDILEMLDNVLTYFIDNAPKELARAVFSAFRERSVGTGALGFHALLQKKNIPFESALAKSINKAIFKHIRSEGDAANIKLAEERGSCPDAEDFGVKRRLSNIMAIAPNASTSILLGNTSPSIELFAANYYRQDTSSGTHFNKNRYLDKIIRDEATAIGDKEFYDATWASIVAHEGSVSHLDWLSDHTKDVFKTATEVDQRWVVEFASDRQQYIDQAQSVNLFFEPDAHIKYIHAVHYMAWVGGLKSLYYCRSKKLRKGSDKVGLKIERKKIEDEIDMSKIIDGTTCIACEG